MSILKIRGTNPLTVVDGGRDLQRKAQDLDELIGKQVHAVQELEQDWKGKAANAARGQAYRNIEHQHRFHEIIDAMANAMIAGGQTLATLRDALLNWVSTVSQMFNVADDGVVTTRPPRTGGAWDNIAATFTKCTHNMIKAFMDQDQNLANSLKTIAGGNTPGNNPKPVPGFTLASTQTVSTTVRSGSSRRWPASVTRQPVQAEWVYPIRIRTFQSWV